MKVSVISYSLGHATLAVAGELSAEHVHQVAEAFIKGARPSSLGVEVKDTFGNWSFRSYVIDYSTSSRARITFSVRCKPELLTYRGGPVAVAPLHATKLEIYIDTCDVVSVVPAVPVPHLYDVGADHG